MLLLCCLAAFVICTNPPLEPPVAFDPTPNVEQIDSFKSICDSSNHREFLEKAKIVLENTIKKYEHIDSLKFSQMDNLVTDPESRSILNPLGKSIEGWEIMVEYSKEQAKTFDVFFSSITLKQVSEVFCLGLRCRLLFQKLLFKQIQDEQSEKVYKQRNTNIQRHAEFRHEQDAKLKQLLLDLTDVVEYCIDNSISHAHESLAIIAFTKALAIIIHILGENTVY